MQGLSSATLAALPPHVERPTYDRQALRPGIVHLGLGAFHRAHEAVVNEAAIRASGDLRWGVVGVSLRSPDTRDALAPQDNLYTVAVLDADEDGAPRERLQVVGCLTRVIVASEDPRAVLEQIAHEDTRIVSLTITEKGYCHEPATRSLRFDDPDIVHDLAHPEAPRSAIGTIVHGLNLRHHRAHAPVTLLSCDNLPANGDTLRGLVVTFAEKVDPALAAWIAKRCTFPNAMVDRIVPRTTDVDRARIAEQLGVYDAAPVVGEPFLEWVIEDQFAAGRPGWDAGGARFVVSAEPFERLKLRFVNAPQSTLAYLGAASGIETNNLTVSRRPVRRFVDTMMRTEIAPTLGSIPGVDLDTFRERLLARVANPALPHRTQQVAMDGTQKVPQRLLGTIADRLRADQPIDHLALAVAAWIHYLRGGDEGVPAYPIRDPLAHELAARLARGEADAHGVTDSREAERRRVAAFTALASVFGDLGADPRLIDAVATHTHSLRAVGVHETLARFLENHAHA